jgi:ubiquinone/menaquinone biosynthesis C-methylase UbiE
MGVAIWQARAVYAAAELGLADILSQGARTSEELASITRTHPLSLRRLLRALASVGILTEAEPGLFATTDLGDALREDAPGAARATILTIAGAWQWTAWHHFLHALRTGESGLSVAYGKDLFGFLAERPEDGARFNKAMVGMHGAIAPAVIAAYDFSRFESVVDIGGGTGALLSAILRAHPRMRGALFDLPETAPQARRLISESKLADRCEILEGDFFKSIPPAHDAYIVSHVLHDWADDQAARILQNCRRAIGDHGRLLIVESVLPEGDTPHHGKLMDLLMLTVTGGVERSARQFEGLLTAGGFKLCRIVTTSTHQSIIEAAPV